MVLSCSMFCQGFSVIGFSLKQFYNIFIMFIYQVICHHFFIVKIAVESVNLIQMLK